MQQGERVAEHPIGAAVASGRYAAAGCSAGRHHLRPRHGETARATAHSASINDLAHQLARSDEPIPVAAPERHPSSGSDADATPESTTALTFNLAREHLAINPIDADRRCRSRVRLLLHPPLPPCIPPRYHRPEPTSPPFHKRSYLLSVSPGAGCLRSVHQRESPRPRHRGELFTLDGPPDDLTRRRDAQSVSFGRGLNNG